MKYSELQDKFKKATRWNSTLFIVSKFNKTLLSFFLFYRLSPDTYVVWANIYSLVYIAILWLNFGFEKSVPQYALKFAQNHASKKSFMRAVIIFKLAVSCIVNAIIIIFIPKLLNVFKLKAYISTLYLGGALFFIDNIKTTLRFLYHSYFWNKAYNIIDSVFSIVGTASIFIVLYGASGLPEVSLINKVVAIDIIAAATVCLVALAISPYLASDQEYSGQKIIDEKNISKSFIKHSCAMWGTTILVSLTERNVLIPFISFSLGPHAAGMFKVANDGALLFQRFVLKTIGTSGTSLFSHVEYNYVEPTTGLTKTASMLSKKIRSLIFPIMSILFFCLIRLHFKESLLVDSIKGIIPNIAQREFFILAILYLYQTLFSPQERILEVKKNYIDLYASFAPYLALLVFYLKIITSNFSHKFSLINIIVIVHTVRFASLIMRAISVYLRYQVSFTFNYVLKYSVLSLFLASTLEALLLLLGW